MRRVVLWRHGRTEWNDLERFQGHTDVPLDDVGVAQARAAAQILVGLRPERIISSDLARASETAAALAQLTDLGVQLDPRLRETNGGRWEGLTAAEIEALPANTADGQESDAALYAAWRRGEDVSAGGAERRSDVAARARAAVDEALPTLSPDGVLCIVTHGGTSRALAGSMLGLGVEQWRVLGGLANACWSVLAEQPSGWRLEEHNAGTLPTRLVGDDR